MKDIKLVIWDLDDTFWKGTLTEGDVEVFPSNINIVKHLTDRGIVNSIVSKNNFDEAKCVLEEMGIFEYFIFPQISWEPKGQTVQKLLGLCKLRAENTLFIDDNHSNLAEVKFYNPEINAVSADYFIQNDIFTMSEFKGKDDHGHSRLKQYKILEKRTAAEGNYASNIEFLKKSHIRIYIGDDCVNEEERIYELIQRTNQLNYTKKRDTKEELHKLLISNEIETRYIRIKDDYGDYGLVGFYALQENHLLHFLFSCRILGLSVENYLYNKLGRPRINIEGETAVLLEKKEIDWIEEGDGWAETKEHKSEKRGRILMVGGCDLEQASLYLEDSFEIRKEFATVRDGQEIRTSDSSQLVNAIELNSETKRELCDKIPFYHEEITFATEMFSGNYDIIIWSVVDDYIRGIYKHKVDGYEVGFAGFFDQEECLAKFDSAHLDYLNKEFTYLGKESPAQFEKNLEKIMNKISKKTVVILINGIEIDVSDWIGEERCERQIEMNAVVDKVVSRHDNVHLLDMRKIVKNRNVLVKKDNRHYSRKVYYQMAGQLREIINSGEGEKIGITKRGRFWASEIKYQVKVFGAKAVHKLRK